MKNSLPPFPPTPLIATKIISKIIKQEIVTKDAIKIRHYKDGSCLCGDY
jgi:hypothetical protein